MFHIFDCLFVNVEKFGHKTPYQSGKAVIEKEVWANDGASIVGLFWARYFKLVSSLGSD